MIGQRGGCRALNNTKRTLQSYRDRERFPARGWRQILLPTPGPRRMAFPQNHSNAIAMPLDYLNEASDELQRLFARLDDAERTLQRILRFYDEVIGRLKQKL